MKKIATALFLVILFGACNNDPVVDAAFSKYQHQDGVVSITVPGFVVAIAVAFADLEPEEEKLLRNIDKVKVLTVEDNGLHGNINFYNEFESLIHENSYTEMLTVNNANEHVRIMAKMNDEDRIKDLILLVGGDDNALVYINGDFTLDEIADVAKKGYKGGFEDLVQF